MEITQADFELIQAVFHDYRDEICLEYAIDEEFIDKFGLKNYR